MIANIPAGPLLSFATRAKTPLFGSHWKYLTPATEPSFFPTGSSNTIPAHSPGANFVSPIKAILPGKN